jgi:hypothetical protein
MSTANTLREKVHAYALKRRGKAVGTGCGDLPHKALGHAGARLDAKANTARDYQWGKPIDLANAVSGDIVRFDRHAAEVKVTKETTIHFPDGSFIAYHESSATTYRRGSADKGHAAIVHSKLNRRGVLTVLETHVSRGRGKKKATVDYGKIYVRRRPPEKHTARQTIKITPRWANKVKSLPDVDKRVVDDVLNRHRGKSFDANVVTTKSIAVRGDIHAYAPMARAQHD